MEIIQHFLIPFSNVNLLTLIAIGTLAGIVIGAIPGLSVTMTVALLLSLTYSWDLQSSLALMLGVFFGGVYGGSRAAILINIPGAPSAIATSFDGYPLAQKGEASIALFLTTIFSFLGGLVGIVFLAAGAPMISKIAINFSSIDYFLLAALGLLLVGSMSEGTLSKGMFSAGLGVIVGIVGMDPLNGIGRFTFGSVNLMSGVEFIPVLLGLFGASEVFYQLKDIRAEKVKVEIKKIASIPFRLITKMIPLSLRSSIIGTVIGALPGAGGDVASLFAYDNAIRTTKKPSRPFGEGAYEGVIAPETANNAAIGGSLVPLLTLGIPGDSVTAIFIGALFIHGLQPGPLLLEQSNDLFWMIVGTSFLANIFLLIFGLLLVRVFIQIIKVPKQILLPIVAVICVIGSYSINNSITDVYWMFGFGIIGFVMKVKKFSVAPLVLGVILGPLAETSLRRGFQSSHNDYGDFLLNFVNSPISLILTIVLVFTVLSQTKWYKQMKKKFKNRSKMNSI